MAARRHWAALIAASTLACGELPGEVVGSYKVTMQLAENSCGEGATHSLDGHRYTAELRGDERRGYWHVPGQRPIEGTYDAPRFHFERSAIVALDGADAGPRGCALRQVDVLTGEVTLEPDADADVGHDDDDASEEAADAGDAGVKETERARDAGADAELALRAEHTFTISALAGADCSVALAPRGRFDKLPCTLRYAVRGVPGKPF